MGINVGRKQQQTSTSQAVFTAGDGIVKHGGTVSGTGGWGTREREMIGQMYEIYVTSTRVGKNTCHYSSIQVE